jgi:hypothetical protein
MRMNTIRMSVFVSPDEKDAVWNLAQKERRDFRDQAALLIHEALVARGLLPSPPTPAPQLAEVAHA